MSGQEYRSIASARAAAPIAARRGSSSSSATTASASAAGSSGATRDRGLRRRHLAVPGDVRRDDGQGTGERAGQHHSEALPAQRRERQGLRPREQGRQLLLRQEAEHVDPVVGDPQAREEEPHRERVGAADLEPGAGAAMDLRPCAQQDVEALARLVPARERDGVLTPAGLDRVRNEDAVRDDLVLAREPSRRRVARALGDGDALVDPAREEPPGRASRASSSRGRRRRGGSRRSAHVAIASTAMHVTGVIGSCR